MKLETLILSGFRCFSVQEPATIRFDKSITLLIGPNGVGKTAVLDALTRMFGINGRGRGLLKSDFHAYDCQTDAPQELYIEALFSFPELEHDGDEHSSVASVFSHICCNEQSALWLRIRLEGRLTFDGSSDGEIEEEIYAVSTLEQSILPKDKVRLRSSVRNRIHVHYIPATRDPSRELNFAASSIFGRILKAGQWNGEGETNKSQAIEFAKSASEALTGHRAVQAVDRALKASWEGLHRGSKLSNPSLRFLPSTLNEMLNQLSLVFRPGAGPEETSLENLSDGHRSLFYLSVVVGLDALERQIALDDTLGFDRARLRSPAYTLLALEEPENHLAPHYLGRIVRHLQEFATRLSAQGIITTHSPSTAARIAPSAIRQLRLNVKREAEVSELDLPNKEEEAFKYVNETIRTHPEMLFARAVILGEGETEQILLPRVLSAYAAVAFKKSKSILGQQQQAQFFLDDSFLSVVPIRGRHVNHFWRLLYGLRIPFATLLDLDRGRYQGGWGRVRYAASQLALWHWEQTARESLKNKLHNIPRWNSNSDPLDDSKNGPSSWLSHLESFGVFFSAPLDLDFMMLEAYSEYYAVNLHGGKGPAEVPEVADDRNKMLSKLEMAVLKKRASPHQFYTEQQKEQFRWYKYLFLSKKGKPAAHLLALSSMPDDELDRKMPSPLKRLIRYVEKLVSEGHE